MRTITRADARIESIHDERLTGGEFFVYLKPGFAFTSPPQHCFGAADAAEIRDTMRRVYPCTCEECRK